jgi:Uma2 family endonuclease
MLSSASMSSSSAPRRRATYDDVLAAPAHKVAEIIDGELFLSPRPAMPHAAAAVALGSEIYSRFGKHRSDPGGWIVLAEPELHFRDDVVVPDIAGWKRDRLPAVPSAPFLELAPDWLCEVLSPSTERIDRVKKLAVYARVGVNHVWFVNARTRMLEVMRRIDSDWRTIGSYLDDAKVRAEPFEAVEIDLAELWANLGPMPTP